MSEREYEIWSEGFEVTGNSGSAMLHGRVMAENFPAAVAILANRDPEFAKCLNPERTAYWGCRLFDNEADARKSFG